METDILDSVWTDPDFILPQLQRLRGLVEQSLSYAKGEGVFGKIEGGLCERFEEDERDGVSGDSDSKETLWEECHVSVESGGVSAEPFGASRKHHF